MVYRRITVRVPATTANLGPGFDCLGLALGLWNSVRLEVGTPGVSITGEGADTLSRGEDNLVFQAVNALFEKVGFTRPNLHLHCRNAIPLGRGLGSSAAAVVGGLVAANAFCNQSLNQEELLDLAAYLEGHPDNITPALLGGFRIVVQDNDHLVTAPVRLPKWLTLVVFIPDTPLSTQQARAVLPSQVSRDEAVYNLGRVAMLVNALATGKIDNLPVATQDVLHQPSRMSLFPALEPIIQAALEAGALGAFLSGGGSSIVALAREREMTIAYEMAEMARKWRVNGEAKVLRPASRGCYVVSAM